MNTLNLATKNTTDFRVLNNGEAFISQRKAADLLGVSHQAIGQKVIGLQPNYIKCKGLDAEMLHLACTHYAFDAKQHCTGEAQQLAKQFMKAGAKASGIMPVKVFDANYGEVNAYHTLAWTTAYPDDRLK